MEKSVDSGQQDKDSRLAILHELDPGQIGALHNEITAALAINHNVKISDQPPDLAYENPREIRRIFEYLRSGDDQLAIKKRELSAKTLARRMIDGVLLGRDRKNEKNIYEQLEPYREQLLYGEDHTNATPWHDQHGRAAALLTIDAAHDLQVAGDEATGEYSTMSGMVDDYESLERCVFRTKDDISGKTLPEALIYTEMEFSGRTPERAREYTDRRLQQLKDFMAAPITREFKDVVQYCTDSLGIRERKVLVNQLITDHLKKIADEEGRAISDMTVMSFGCGTAKPVMEGIQQIMNETRQAPTLVLLDQDPIALAIAMQLADKMGVSEKVEIHCRRLFNRFGSPVDIQDILQGRQLDVAEDSGLREYLPDIVYKKLTKAAWSNLRDGGLMVTGNMNKNRPQPEFLHGLMGWFPYVQMRTVEEGFRLHKKSGIPPEATRALVVPSGVYTVFASQK